MICGTTRTMTPASIKVQKGHTKVNVQPVQGFDMENTPEDEGSNQSRFNDFWTFIALTRYLD